MRKLLSLSLTTALLSGCTLAPSFKLPDIEMPSSFKQQPAAAAPAQPVKKGLWQEAKPLEQADRGQWWKIFGDEQLNELEAQAAGANQDLKAATARVEQARATMRANRWSFLPDLDIGGNAVRAKNSNAAQVAYGAPPGVVAKPYTLFSASGVLTYEVDLFGRIRDNYSAIEHDTQAQEAAYRSALLALQADVAQAYFAIRGLDAERQLMRETIAIREESNRIINLKREVGEIGDQDSSRSVAELAAVKAELLALDRQRAGMENAMAVLLGRMPSEFMYADAPLTGLPPAIPAGLPSSLLERRPDVTAATAAMAAANSRIGVARAAFFPSLTLTANGGYTSSELGDLFKWDSRTWALGQAAGMGLTMPIFHSGRILAGLDRAEASYDESVANYRQSVLIAFRDVEDSLAAQRLLAEQFVQQEQSSLAAARATELTLRRYREGDVDYFEVVNAERDSLAASRAAFQLRALRFTTTVSLIRALGGGWDEQTLVTTAAPVEAALEPPTAESPAQESPTVESPVAESPAVPVELPPVPESASDTSNDNPVTESSPLADKLNALFPPASPEEAPTLPDPSEVKPLLPSEPQAAQ